jgi:2-polyprenyl-3-methyl-5-hydroxy-6-metoxy-1,4-benzoquinol methylase
MKTYFTSIKTLTKTWDNEAEKYNHKTDRQVDYLANYHHMIVGLGKVKGKKILEVGCGTGQTSAYLAKRGAHVSLVDISQKALDYCKSYYKQKKIPVKLYKQNALRMKFPPESFDYVWNGGVIEHFSDTEKVLMLKKMWRLVKPGGKLLISAPNAYDFPFMVAKKILQFRKKWSFGVEDDLTILRMKRLAEVAGINNFLLYSYNPIVGFWFFPFGRELMDILGLNKLKYHKLRSPFGHVINFVALRK